MVANAASASNSRPGHGRDLLAQSAGLSSAVEQQPSRGAWVLFKKAKQPGANAIAGAPSAFDLNRQQSMAVLHDEIYFGSSARAPVVEAGGWRHQARQYAKVLVDEHLEERAVFPLLLSSENGPT